MTNLLAKRTLATLTLAVAVAFASAPTTAAEPIGSLYINNHSHLCMDVAYGSVADGARIQQWYCYGGPPERWTLIHKRTVGLTYYFQLVNANSPANSPKCLDLPWNNGYPGATLQLWSCWDTDAQLWAVETQSLTGTARVKHYDTDPAPDLCLDNTDWSNFPGTSLQLWPCNDLPPQQWYVP